MIWELADEFRVKREVILGGLHQSVKILKKGEASEKLASWPRREVNCDDVSCGIMKKTPPGAHIDH